MRFVYNWGVLDIGQQTEIPAEKVDSARVSVQYFQKKTGRKIKSKFNKEQGVYIFTRVE